ncbi:MAG: hypothetical protein P1P64_03140 [Treponemataceae bacterium]
MLSSKKNNLDLYTEITEPPQMLFFNSALFNKNIYLFVVQNILYPVYSLLILMSIYFLFEKTYVIEISFFTFFALFLSLESFKLLTPFFNLWNFAPNLVLLLSRALYFFRFISVLLLLVAATFTVTPITRRILPVLFAISFLAVAITFSTPFNTSNLMFNFLLQDGLNKLTKIAFWFFTLATTITYLVVGKNLGTKEYTKAGWGIFALLSGYFFTLITASLFFFILSNTLFLVGCFFYSKAIHQYNLWQ